MALLYRRCYALISPSGRRSKPHSVHLLSLEIRDLLGATARVRKSYSHALSQQGPSTDRVTHTHTADWRAPPLLICSRAPRRAWSYSRYSPMLVTVRHLFIRAHFGLFWLSRAGLLSFDLVYRDPHRRVRYIHIIRILRFDRNPTPRALRMVYFRAHELFYCTYCSSTGLDYPCTTVLTVLAHLCTRYHPAAPNELATRIHGAPFKIRRFAQCFLYWSRCPSYFSVDVSMLRNLRVAFATQQYSNAHEFDNCVSQACSFALLGARLLAYSRAALAALHKLNRRWPGFVLLTNVCLPHVRVACVAQCLRLEMYSLHSIPIFTLAHAVPQACFSFIGARLIAVGARRSARVRCWPCLTFVFFPLSALAASRSVVTAPHESTIGAGRDCNLGVLVLTERARCMLSTVPPLDLPALAGTRAGYCLDRHNPDLIGLYSPLSTPSLLAGR